MKGKSLRLIILVLVLTFVATMQLANVSMFWGVALLLNTLFCLVYFLDKFFLALFCLAVVLVTSILRGRIDFFAVVYFSLPLILRFLTVFFTLREKGFYFLMLAFVMVAQIVLIINSQVFILGDWLMNVFKNLITVSALYVVLRNLMLDPYYKKNN